MTVFLMFSCLMVGGAVGFGHYGVAAYIAMLTLVDAICGLKPGSKFTDRS